MYYLVPIYPKNVKKCVRHPNNSKECISAFIIFLRFRMPYRTFETDKGGNAALMAPEVVTAMPGTFTNINYTKVIVTVLRNQIRLVLVIYCWNPDWPTLNRDKQG